MISKLKTLCAKNRINLLCFKTVGVSYRVNTKYECFQKNQVVHKRYIHNSIILNNNKPKQDSKKGKNEKKDQKTNPDDNNETSQLLVTTAFWMVTSYLVVVGITLLFPSGERANVASYVTWNEFVNNMLSKKQVERILIDPDFDLVTIILREGAVLNDNVVRNRVFHMTIADSEKFEEKVRKAESNLGLAEPTPLDYIRNNYTPFMISFVALALILVLLLSKAKSNTTPIIQDLFSQMGRAKFTLIDPYTGDGKGVKFSDVAGLREAKIELKEFIDYLRQPERYKSLGAKVPKGALLLGPPGCGKTLLAKAVATECKVPFLSMNGSEFVEMIGGLGAARVRDLFKEAKIRAPCIVYIDEIDAIGKKRSISEGGGKNWDGVNTEGDQTLNQLLVEMDGIIAKENIMVLASTNRPDMLDKALLRPGRFDRHIFIDLPTIKERKEIFERHLRNIVLEKDPAFYSWKLSHTTTGFNSAQIANVCNEAALHAARMKKNKVGTEDLEYALERIQFGSEKKNYTISKEEKKLMAYHESGHAIVGWHMKYADPLLKVTIHPRTNSMTGFTQYAAIDKYLLSRDELMTKMCVLMGSRVAEVMMFNRTTTGAQSDLDQATKIAYSMVKEYGMSDSLGLMAFSKHKGRKPYSKTLSSLIDLEVNRLVAETYFMTKELLDKHFYMMKILAEGLLAKETLNSEEIERLIGPSPYAEALVARRVNFFK